MKILEEGESSFGASVPDLPGCVAVAETKTEVLKLIKEAIEFHLEGLHEEQKQIPKPLSSAGGRKFPSHLEIRFFEKIGFLRPKSGL